MMWAQIGRPGHDARVDLPDEVRFDEVVVRLAAREVLHRGEHEHLEPQAFDLLRVLIRERDRVVTKAELLDEVWGDQFVSESALTTRIKEIRRAVGDDGRRQSVVRNVRGRGYRFVAPLRAVPRDDRSGPVPVARTILVGRAVELQAAQALLTANTVLSLVGPGGVGKTALATAIAAAAAEQFDDGVITVPLATVADDQSVVPAVRRAAGLAGGSPVGDDDVVEQIAPLHAVVVLDNCEHVIEGAARLAHRLAFRSTSLRVVATSRERLGIRDEQVLPVDVLDAAAARELFLARARAAQPGFRLRPGDDAILDRVLGMVDRLPLAIEMAAARVAVLGLDDLAALLSEHLTMLESPDRAADARHRTVAAMVSWSDELLDASRRAAFSGFSVFAGSVAAPDVIGVLGGERGSAVMADLAGLVDRSLVVPDTTRAPSTYRMLATIRSYACVRQDPSTQRRHAEWFADLVEQMDGVLRTPDEGQAHRRVDGVVDELRAAHRWARQEDAELAARMTRALDLFAHSRHWPEPTSWAESLLPMLDDGSSARPGVWAAIASEAAQRGDYRRSRTLARAAQAAADARVRASVLETLGDIALYSGDLQEAVRFSSELRHLGDDNADPHAGVMGVLGEALARTYGGHPEEALALTETVDVAGMAPSDHAWLRYAQAEALAPRDPTAALTAYSAAVDLAEPVGGAYPAGVARVSRLALLTRRGDPTTALADFSLVLRQYRRAGDISHSITALRTLVDLLVRLGHDETAMLILGAVDDATLKPSYGDEQERMAAATSLVTRRVGRTRTESWIKHGQQHGSPAWALELAIEQLDDLTVPESRPRTR